RVEELGLFVSAEMSMVSFRQVFSAFEAYGQLGMLDGRASDIICFAPEHSGVDGGDMALMLNPWSYYLLRPFGALVGALDLGSALDSHPEAPSAQEYRHNPSRFIESEFVDTPEVSGWIGFPHQIVERPRFAVVASDRSQVLELREPAITFGFVGAFILEKTADSAEKTTVEAWIPGNWAELVRLARRASTRLVESLLGQLDDL